MKNSLYEAVVKSALEAIQEISDPKDVAKCYIELADVLKDKDFSTDGSAEEEPKEMPVEETKPAKETKKTAKKETPKKKEEPKEEVIEEEDFKEINAEGEEIPFEKSKEEEINVENLTDEWTEDAIKHFQEQYDEIQHLRQTYGDETANEVANAFFNSENGEYTIEDITPLNVVGFMVVWEAVKRDNDIE